MLTRQNFLECYEQGKRYHSKGFLLFVLIRPASVPWRLGLAVSKKVGRANVRNRVKRVLREFFRLCRPTIPNGIDIVAVPKRSLDVPGLTLASAFSDLEPVLLRIQADLERLARQDGLPV